VAGDQDGELENWVNTMDIRPYRTELEFCKQVSGFIASLDFFFGDDLITARFFVEPGVTGEIDWILMDKELNQDMVAEALEKAQLLRDAINDRVRQSYDQKEDFVGDEDSYSLLVVMGTETP